MDCCYAAMVTQRTDGSKFFLYDEKTPRKSIGIILKKVLTSEFSRCKIQTIQHDDVEK